MSNNKMKLLLLLTCSFVMGPGMDSLLEPSIKKIIGHLGTAETEKLISLNKDTLKQREQFREIAKANPYQEVLDDINQKIPAGVVYLKCNPAHKLINLNFQLSGRIILRLAKIYDQTEFKKTLELLGTTESDTQVSLEKFLNLLSHISTLPPSEISSLDYQLMLFLRDESKFALIALHEFHPIPGFEPSKFLHDLLLTKSKLITLFRKLKLYEKIEADTSYNLTDQEQAEFVQSLSDTITQFTYSPIPEPMIKEYSRGMPFDEGIEPMLR